MRLIVPRGKEPALVSALDSGTDDLNGLSKKDWARISPLILAILLSFFGLFLYQLVRGMELPRLVDSFFMQIHAGGHALFRVFGMTAGVAGGTALQLLVPLALAYFAMRRRQPQGVALCLFFFFEQFLPIARYMADAQAQQLPLTSLGRYDSVIHDWNYMFIKLGVLQYDTVIGALVQSIGCLGMIGVAGWFLWRGVNDLAADR